MNSISQKEIARQYRVLMQTIDMHATLQTRYRRRVLAAQVILLAGAVLFVATRFGSEEFFSTFGIPKTIGETSLKIASIIAFLASLLLLLFDWSGRAGRHESALKRLSQVLKAFRESEKDDGVWNDTSLQNLSDTYWCTMNEVEPIPSNRFTELKSRYLIKKEISILKDRHPGCPRFILWLCVVWGDTWRAASERRAENSEKG